MSKLVAELMSMYEAGSSIEDLYESAYKAGLPFEAVEIFVNTLLEENGVNDSYDESMDGDAESALASAGYGTDEDYGYFGGDE
jgi:hypothetical protein